MKKLFILFMLCLLPIFAFAETVVPELTGHLNDFAGVIAPHLRGQLEARLADFEKETSNQIVVLTVSTLEDDDIFSFSQRVFESWKLGQKSKDNGILIVVVKDRVDAGKGKSIRIHTGRGLEGALPDITCTHIVVDFMKPLMRDGKYVDGFNAGIDKIIAATKGEYKPTTSDVATNHKTESYSAYDVGVFVVGFIIFVIASAILAILGGFTAAIVTFLLIPSSTSAVVTIFIVLAAFLIGWGIAWLIRQGGFSDNGLSSDSGGFGSSSDSGGFSGGGGDSGGGGGGD